MPFDVEEVVLCAPPADEVLAVGSVDDPIQEEIPVR